MKIGNDLLKSSATVQYVCVCLLAHLEIHKGQKFSAIKYKLTELRDTVYMGDVAVRNTRVFFLSNDSRSNTATIRTKSGDNKARLRVLY